MKVAELMSVPVSTCHPTETMDRAAEVMWERDCGCVPVVDARDRVHGVITDRDVCMAAWSFGHALNEIPIELAMSGGAHCCGAEDEIEDALRVMAENQLHRLPVVDEETRLVGVLSIADVVQVMQDELKPKPSQEALHLMKTLATLTRPRRRTEEPRGETPEQPRELHPVEP